MNEADVIATAASNLRKLLDSLSVVDRKVPMVECCQISDEIRNIIDLLTQDESGQWSKEIRVNRRIVELLEILVGMVSRLGLSENPYVREARTVAEGWREGPYMEYLSTYM